MRGQGYDNAAKCVEIIVDYKQEFVNLIIEHFIYHEILIP